MADEPVSKELQYLYIIAKTLQSIDKKMDTLIDGIDGISSRVASIDDISSEVASINDVNGHWTVANLLSDIGDKVSSIEAAITER